MTSRIDASSASEEQRRVATTPRMVQPASPASPFAPAWSRARRRSSEPSRDNAKPPRAAFESRGGPMQAAPPIAGATWPASLASTPRAQSVRHAPARDTVDRTPAAPNTKAALRRRTDAAHAATTASSESTTTIEPGWPGVRLVLRALGSSWRLDWIGPRPNALGATALRALGRRFRDAALGALRMGASHRPGGRAD